MATASIYHNGEYLAKHPTWHSEDSPWKAKQIRTMWQRHAMQPETVCEIGCGAGETLVELQRTSDDATSFWGYEVSPQAFELCQSRSNSGLYFVHADILEDPPFQRFDVVLVMDVVEHVEDYMRFLRKIHPVGHKFIFHFPLDLSVQGIARGIPLKVRETAGHLHYFTKDLVLRSLGDAGYDVIDHFYTPSADATRSPRLGTRLMRWPRKALFGLDRDAAALWLGGFSLLVLAA